MKCLCCSYQIEGMDCTHHVHGQIQAHAARLIKNVINIYVLNFVHFHSLKIHVQVLILDASMFVLAAVSDVSGNVSTKLHDNVNKVFAVLFSALSHSLLTPLNTDIHKTLYTVIPHNNDLLSLKHYLDFRADPHSSTSTLFCLSKLVLPLNCFSCAGSFYHQVSTSGHEYDSGT